MLPGAVVLALGGAVGMGMGSPVQRHVLKKGAQLFTEPEFLLGKFITCWMWSIVLFIPLWMVFGGQVLVANPPVFWGAMLVWFLANVIIQTANLFAARYADVSLTLPYQATTPGILTAAVFLLGERPSMWGYIGIFTIAIGTYIHGRLGCGSFSAYFIPLWRLLFLPANYHSLDVEAQEKVRNERKGVRLAFLSAFCGTFGLLGEAMMARHGNPALGFSIGMLFLTLFSVVWYFVMKRIAEKARMNSSAVTPALPSLVWRIARHRKWLVLGGFFLAIASFLPMIANRLAPIAYVGTMKRLAIPIGVFAAAQWFREKVPPGRWVTTGIITMGAMILVFDDTPAKVIDIVDRLLNHSAVP